MEIHGLEGLTRSAAGLHEWRPCGHTQCPVWRFCGLKRALRDDWAECRTWGRWQEAEAAARARFLADYLRIREAERRLKGTRLAEEAARAQGEGAGAAPGERAAEGEA